MAEMADTPERFVVHESGAWFHGTKADLQVGGDHLTPGYRSNYRPEHVSNHIYLTKVLDGAVLAAEMARGDGPSRVYIVEPPRPSGGRPERDGQAVSGQSDALVPHRQAGHGRRGGDDRLGSPILRNTFSDSAMDSRC